MVVHGGLILLCHLVLNLIKTSAASSNKFKKKHKTDVGGVGGRVGGGG